MKIISGVFHPLLMASYMSAILCYFAPEVYSPYPQEAAWRLSLAFFILTAVFPSIAVFALWYFTSLVTDLELSERRERIVPFVVLIVFYVLTGKLLVFDLQLGRIIQVLLFSAVGMIGIMIMINLRFKISIHASAIWALAGYSLALSMKFALPQLLPVSLAIMISAGLIGTSRLYLGYHQPKEVWAGTALGLVYSFLLTYFLL